MNVIPALPQVVGSFGSAAEIARAEARGVLSECDLAEIRLDLLVQADAGVDDSLWSHLDGVPLLFTARRIEEGGAMPLDSISRMALLEKVLDRAAWIDIEVASLVEMAPLIGTLNRRGLPWIASYHDFHRLPDVAALVHGAHQARQAGATVFKAAAMLNSPAELARLAEFQLEDHGLGVATMGMGPLAPVSRVLCAQCGSIFNYGFLGETATAPGQWRASLLKAAISESAPYRPRKKEPLSIQ